MTTQNTIARDVTTMIFYDMSQQYHAERTRSATEQRRIDDERGMMAARAARAWRRVAGRGQTGHTGRGGRGGSAGRPGALRARYAGQ